MPCNSDYLNPSSMEKSLSQVACLLDELKGKSIEPEHWRGYHPNVYNQALDGDNMVSELCQKLQKVEDITQYSLEMQIWWRDHQKADKERLQSEIRQQKNESEKAAALKKLTKYERELLGLE